MLNDPKYFQNAIRLMKMQEFQELRGGKDFVYHIHYVNNYGIDHLINKSHKNNSFRKLDYDIIFELLTYNVLLVYWLYKMKNK